MWLDKKRIAQVLKDNGLTLIDLSVQLGISPAELGEILDGKQPVNRKTAATLLALFGIWNVTWAMKDNWRWMPYAIQAILAH